MAESISLALLVADCSPDGIDFPAPALSYIICTIIKYLLLIYTAIDRLRRLQIQLPEPAACLLMRKERMFYIARLLVC